MYFMLLSSWYLLEGRQSFQIEDDSQRCTAYSHLTVKWTEAE